MCDKCQLCAAVSSHPNQKLHLSSPTRSMNCPLTPPIRDFVREHLCLQCPESSLQPGFCHSVRWCPARWLSNFTSALSSTSSSLLFLLHVTIVSRPTFTPHDTFSVYPLGQCFWLWHGFHLCLPPSIEDLHWASGKEAEPTLAWKSELRVLLIVSWLGLP